jgi:hypothetical protein
MRVARMCAGCILCLLAGLAFRRSAGAGAQTTSPVYRLIVHNHYAQVFDLNLGPERQVPIRDNNNDLLWVALDSGILEVQSRDENARDFHFQAGDVRLFRRHELRPARNKTGSTVHSVIVELLRLNEGGCGCATEVARVVCGCAPSGLLPPYWALALYGATLAETTLEPGQSLKESTNRDDTLLIAISTGELQHEGSTSKTQATLGSVLTLQPGAVNWLPEGRHQLTNIGTTAARFVTVEF